MVGSSCPQDIKLEDVLIDIVEVKVSGLPFSCHIICRILDWSKVIDIHIVWNNNDSPGADRSSV